MCPVPAQRYITLKVERGSRTTGFQNKATEWYTVILASLTPRHTLASWGTWCSGITSASHAEGPGFKAQCVHLSRLVCVNCSCVPSATASPRAFFAGFQCVASPLATFVIFQLGQRRNALNIRFGSGFANRKKEVNCALSKL